NGAAKFTTRIRRDGSTLYLEYRGEDGNLTYRLQPKSGTWSDVTARWNDGARFLPLPGGGVLQAADGRAVGRIKAAHKSTQARGDEVVSNWTLSANGVSQDVTYVYRLWNKSLVIDTLSRGGKIAEVNYGHATGVASPRLVWNPFLTYISQEERPGVLV